MVKFTDVAAINLRLAKVNGGAVDMAYILVHSELWQPYHFYSHFLCLSKITAGVTQSEILLSSLQNLTDILTHKFNNKISQIRNSFQVFQIKI